ncbi:hypothetical protein HMPREF0397_1042 [Fusobacterium nucleatum subsp. nucleatum ATCC 23726]|uniref:Uncharacterized protein n=1 Tax=Fusobacterium nucleatum subsp. nucleatum (strain ATCC 23726 / VPI 4351) TaxID=525283 RepID=D5RCV7_FUSN2|nr:hypothetical protein HMPREF0397_1042 [Fusobacterium nucleatum subsp. nucleatum ATCC 23726]
MSFTFPLSSSKIIIKSFYNLNIFLEKKYHYLKLLYIKKLFIKKIVIENKD